MRKIIQKRIVEVIQPEIVQFICDYCGKVCGTRNNPKTTWHNNKKIMHYCKKSFCKEKEHVDDVHDVG